MSDHKMIFGLGNPGQQYARTRHNVGFLVVEHLATELVSNSGQLELVDQSADWQLSRTLQAKTWQARLAGQPAATKLSLFQPETFMNKSGVAVQAAIRKQTDWQQRQDFSGLCLAYDDLDLEVGRYKLVFGSGPKVHNGVASVVQQLGSDQFWHARVGVDGRQGDRSVSGREYVLQTFSPAERELLESAIAELGQDLIRWTNAPNP